MFTSELLAVSTMTFCLDFEVRFLCLCTNRGHFGNDYIVVARWISIVTRKLSLGTALPLPNRKISRAGYVFSELTTPATVGTV